MQRQGEKGSFSAIRGLWLVILFSFIFPSFASAQRWHYVLLEGPPSYPLHWGEREPQAATK